MRSEELVQTVTLPLPSGSETLQHRMRSDVEPLQGAFRLISKLSPAGIVVRGLNSPPSQRPFFGILREDGFSVAACPPGPVTPYQPILRARWPEPGDRSVDLELRPHPQADLFLVLYTLGGLFVGITALFTLPERSLLGSALMLLAGLCLAFPRLRRRESFDEGCRLSLERFREVFLTAEPPSRPQEGGSSSASQDMPGTDDP